MWSQALATRLKPIIKRKLRQSTTNSGVGVDEAGQAWGEHHHSHGDGHGRHHDAEVIHHADGGDDGSPGEDRIQHRDHAITTEPGIDAEVPLFSGLASSRSCSSRWP